MCIFSFVCHIAFCYWFLMKFFEEGTLSIFSASVFVETLFIALDMNYIYRRMGMVLGRVFSIN